MSVTHDDSFYLEFQIETLRLLRAPSIVNKIWNRKFYSQEIKITFNHLKHIFKVTNIEN